MQFPADPDGLQGIRADDDRVRRSFLDGFLNLGPERVAAAKFAGIDPASLSVVGKRHAELTNKGIVF